MPALFVETSRTKSDYLTIMHLPKSSNNKTNNHRQQASNNQQTSKNKKQSTFSSFVFYPTLPPRKGRANAVQTFYRLLASYPMSWIHHWSPPSFGAVVCTKCLCKHLRQCCTTIQKGQGGWEFLIPLYTFGSACSQNGHRV